MDIIIQSLGFKASDELERMIHEKLNKITGLDNIVRANVTLYIGSDGNPENNYCEIRLEVPGNDHFVKCSADVFERAVTEATDKLQKIIRVNKEKNIKTRQKASDADLPIA